MSSAQRITASAASAERSEVLVRCKPKLASNFPDRSSLVHSTGDKRQAIPLVSLCPSLDAAEPTCRAHRVRELAEEAISTGLIGPQSKQTVGMGNYEQVP